MNIYFSSASILLTLYTGWLYIPNILQGKIKPHAFSWLPWTILTALACIIQIKNGENFWGFGPLAASTLICILIFFLSLKKGEKNITRGDVLSLIASSILIIFWIGTQNDIQSLIFLCLVDAVSFFPTWRKSWHKPFEEGISMYTLSSFKSFLSLFSFQHFILVNVFYPFFLILINLSFSLYLFWRRKVITK